MPFPRLVWVFDPNKHQWKDPAASGDGPLIATHVSTEEIQKIANQPIVRFKKMASTVGSTVGPPLSRFKTKAKTMAKTAASKTANKSIVLFKKVSSSKAASKSAVLFNKVAARVIKKKPDPVWVCPLCSSKNKMTTSKCAVCPGVKPVEEASNLESKKEPPRTKLRKLMDQLQTEKQRKNGLKGIIAASPPGPSRPALMGSTVPMQEVVLHTPVADLAEHCNSLNESAPVLSSDGSMAAILQGNRLLFLSGTKQDRASLIVIPKRKNMDGTKSDVTYSYGPMLVSTVHLNQTHYNATPVLSATGDLVVVKNLRDYLGFSRRGTLLWRYRHRKDTHDASDDTDDEADPLDMFEWVKKNDVVGSLDNLRSGPGTHTAADKEKSKLSRVKSKMNTVTDKIGSVKSKVSSVTNKLSSVTNKVSSVTSKLSRVAPEPVSEQQTRAVAGTDATADEEKVTPMTPTSPTSPTRKTSRVAPESVSAEQTVAVVGTNDVEDPEQEKLITPVSTTSPTGKTNRVAPEPLSTEQAGPAAGTDTAVDEVKLTPMTPTPPASPSSKISEVAPESVSVDQAGDIEGKNAVEAEAKQQTPTTPISQKASTNQTSRVAPEPINTEQTGAAAGTDTAGDEEKVEAVTPTSPTSDLSGVTPDPASAEQPVAAPRDPKAIFASFDGVKLVQPVPPDPYYGKPPPSSKRFIVARTVAKGVFSEVSQKVKKKISDSKKVRRDSDSEDESNETTINKEKGDDTNADKEKNASANRDGNGEMDAVEGKSNGVSVSEDNPNQVGTNGETTEDTNTASEEQNNVANANDIHAHSEQNIDTIPIKGEQNDIDAVEGKSDNMNTGEAQNTETEPNAGARKETKNSETKNDENVVTAVVTGPPSVTAEAMPTVRVRSRADFLLHSCTPPRVSRDGRLVLVKYEYDLVFLDGASGAQVGCIPTREMHIDSLPWVEADPYTEWGYLVCARDGVRVKMWHCILQEAIPATIMLLWEYHRPVGKIGRGIFPHAPRISSNGAVVIFRWENKIISLDAQAGTVNAMVDCASMNAHQGGGQVGMNDDASLVCCVEKQNIVARDGYTLETLWRHKVRNGFFEPFTPVVSAAGDIVLFKVWAMLVWLDGRNGNPVITRNCNDTSCIPGGITHDGKGWTRLKQRPTHTRDTYFQNTFSMTADASHVVATCSNGKQVLCFHVNECYRGEYLAQAKNQAPVMPSFKKPEKEEIEPSKQQLEGENDASWGYSQTPQVENYGQHQVTAESAVVPYPGYGGSYGEGVSASYEGSASFDGSASYEGDGSWGYQDQADGSTY